MVCVLTCVRRVADTDGHTALRHDAVSVHAEAFRAQPQLFAPRAAVPLSAVTLKTVHSLKGKKGKYQCRGRAAMLRGGGRSLSEPQSCQSFWSRLW